MGAARSALRRTIRSPMETRAKLDKVLENDPQVAPKHESTKIILEKAKVENQAAFESSNQKNDHLLDRLKDIHVNTVEQTSAKKQSSSTPTPTGRAHTRLSNEQLSVFFQHRMTNPQQWTEAKLAGHFELPLTTVENFVKYYSDFNVEMVPQIPEPLAEITF